MLFRSGEQRRYLVSLSKQILVQEHDAVRAGTPLSDGVITPADILAIKGPTAVQEYIVNEVQDVYRLQGVKINDKHFEIIVRQMMRKVQINEPGDTSFLEQEKFPFYFARDLKIIIMMNSTAPMAHSTITPLTPGFLTSILETNR